MSAWMMMKQPTLVLTVAAVARIEERLLTHMHSVDVEREGKHKYTHSPKPFHNDPFLEQAKRAAQEQEVREDW